MFPKPKGTYCYHHINHHLATTTTGSKERHFVTPCLGMGDCVCATFFLDIRPVQSATKPVHPQLRRHRADKTTSTNRCHNPPPTAHISLLSWGRRRVMRQRNKNSEKRDNDRQEKGTTTTRRRTTVTKPSKLVVVLVDGCWGAKGGEWNHLPLFD